MSRIRIVLFAVVSLCALALMADVSAGATRHHHRGHSVLFTQSSQGGSLKSDGRGEMTLTLYGVAPQVIWFQDRPGRRTGHLSVTEFVSRWRSFGFVGDPPNAALTLLDAPDEADTTVVELRRPRYNPIQKTMTYTARRLKKATGKLASFEDDRDARIPEQFAAASLFIDSADGSPVQAPTVSPDPNDPTLISTFAAGTPITLVDGTPESIENIVLGQQVMSLDAYGRSIPGTVIFSQCNPVGVDQMTLYLDYGAGNQILISSPYSLVGSNHQLVGIASPGTPLMSVGGGMWMVNRVTMGNYTGLMCGIKVDGTAWYLINGLPVDGYPVP